jgi:DNA helicase II / ATP-dependent DNA helicase PcrA
VSSSTGSLWDPGELATSEPVHADRGDPAALLEGLTEPQASAVVHRGSPLLIVAGAGSGKTRVLTRRIAHLLATGDARPHEILAITFTNKAADEMRSRVVELVGEQARSMWVSTFHSACLKILRSNADRQGYDPGFSVYDDQDSKRLLELVMGELDIDVKKLPVRNVAASISNAKAELRDPARFAESISAFDLYADQKIATYEHYQARLRAANAMDFDDLLMQTVVLFATHPEVLAGYQDRFRHILVDEYQDTNRAQNELVLQLGRAHRNVCVVGDSDQSIYRFRSADIRNILDFERTFPDATTIVLDQNFRSTQRILDAANAVIAHNTGRPEKRLFTTKGEGARIMRYRAEDERDEAAWVAAQIHKHQVSGVRLDEIAIFYRTNAQSRSIELALQDAGIAYKVIGGTRYFDRREVRDALAYLRVLANPADEVSARRITTTPKRGIGATSLAKLSRASAELGIPMAQLFGHEALGGIISGKALRGCRELAGVLAELVELSDVLSTPELVEATIERSGLKAELEAEETHESLARLENLAELIGAAQGHESLAEFLESVALVAAADDLEEGARRVSLMTLHTAKGLEYRVVYVVGMEDGIFPHFSALSEPEELEEERRLAYVGITRAMESLTLTHAWTRSLWGRTSANLPSRFLGEIPEEVVEEAGQLLAGHRRSDGTRSAGLRLGGPSDVDADEHLDDATPVIGLGAPRAPASSTGGHLLGLVAGDVVVHDRWGEGAVLSTSGEGDRATAVVRFGGGVGEKTLMLSMAPLRRP